MKIAPLYKALCRQNWCEPHVVFLEQHNSANMGVEIFKELGVDDDVTRLSLAQGDLGQRLGSIISTYTRELQNDKPDLVVVPGDVDVSLGAAIAAKRELRVVAHLEAGLRSNDMRMPEELNRIMIDAISDILLAPSEAAAENLIYAESRPREIVHFVGNIMIDSLKAVLNPERKKKLLQEHDLHTKKFAVVTFHRPSNVDDSHTLERIVSLIEHLATERAVIFPIHPRTDNKLTEQQRHRIMANKNILLTRPMAYPDFVNLVANAEFVVTDSGGIQEETSYLGIPCLTLRETTERPITAIVGTNVLVSFDDIVVHAERVSHRSWKVQPIPLWDGETAFRCGHVFNTWWRNRRVVC